MRKSDVHVHVQCEGGGQPVVVLDDGCEVCVALPFLPHSDLMAAAFAALYFSVSRAAVSWIIGKMHSLKGDLSNAHHHFDERLHRGYMEQLGM